MPVSDKIPAPASESPPISVVIPTCNRRISLLRLLHDLNQSSYPLSEVIIVDSGDTPLLPADLLSFPNLELHYLRTERSVCVQRNKGIQTARSSWIFLCDDDIEMPPDYLTRLMAHAQSHPDAVALSGLILQKDKEGWQSMYPVRSPFELYWKFIFRLGIWGEIQCQGPLVKKIKNYYRQRGNHLSAAGWPVLTEFSGDSFTTPVYGLGASLVQREWLLASPYDETLDPHGIGDNYGVAAGFPPNSIHVLNSAFVYHHQETVNRLQRPLQYERRVLALDYFVQTKPALYQVKRRWLILSLIGNLLGFLAARDFRMIWPALRSSWQIATGRNPYLRRCFTASRSRPAFAALPWLAFLAYLLLTAYAMAHHELWADELHSWNIAKGSGSYTDLLSNRRYEGHPGGWYTILWIISKYTHQLAFMQGVHWTIALLSVYLILFRSPFPLAIRLLIPFGYYFLFEYTLLSRNYAMGVLLALCICWTLRQKFKYRTAVYYVLLFCLSNIHLLTLLLAASIHVYYLLSYTEQRPTRSALLLHLFAGVVILFPAAWSILPPSDSEMNAHFWISRLQDLSPIPTEQAPLRSFFPMPAWWEPHFWNTQFLLTAEEEGVLTPHTPLLMAALLGGLALLLLARNKKALSLFICNILLSALVSFFIFPLTSARYAGFLFIGFIVALWLYCNESPLTVPGRTGCLLLLILQLPAGFFALGRDIQRPFSNLYLVNQLAKEVPPGDRLVTDYWTMNAVSAFTDHPVWCVDMEKNMSFLLWDPDIARLRQSPNRYSGGIRHLFSREGIKTIYLISMTPPQLLEGSDSSLYRSFRVSLADKKEGAIEKGSNLYLYQISACNP